METALFVGVRGTEFLLVQSTTRINPSFVAVWVAGLGGCAAREALRACRAGSSRRGRFLKRVRLSAISSTRVATSGSKRRKT